jgi:hypothetical protein
MRRRKVLERGVSPRERQLKENGENGRWSTREDGGWSAGGNPRDVLGVKLVLGR